jgi:uncharacterized protein
MSEFLTKPCTAFDGRRILAAGPLIDVAMAVKAAIENGMEGPVLTFDDATGSVVDLDLRGTAADVVKRLSQHALNTQSVEPPDTTQAFEGKAAADAAPRGRGRPKLGVVAREVTLLPKHWQWLAEQPGGASATLRRLVHDARRKDEGHADRRARQARAYGFMSAMAGDLPGFEEASRALFAGSRDGFAEHTASWPEDVRTYVCALAEGPQAGATVQE